MTPKGALFLRQLIDLQNRVTELSKQGRLDELTHTEVALLSYALGNLSAQVMQELQSPKAPRRRRTSKKARAAK